MESQEYLRLKKELKDKYTEIIFKLIDEKKEEIDKIISDVLGGDYGVMKERFISLERYIDKTKEDFFASDDYVAVKNKVNELKKEIDGDKNADMEKQAELYKALSNLATLNTTLNNRLKEARTRLTAIRSDISDLFAIHDEELEKIKIEYSKTFSKELNAVLHDFNKELKQLKIDFGVTDLNPEFPFDVESVQLDFATDKFQSEYFNKKSSADSDELDKYATTNFVVSENDCDFSN